jgi:HAE1 family hydrophobic/amphiphilic exporter-1
MAAPGWAWASFASLPPTRLRFRKGVRAATEGIQAILPEGVDIRVTSDDATFISGAIEEVRTTLMLAVLIVIGIIFLFLRDWRATIIPAVTLPVALIGRSRRSGSQVSRSTS